MIRTIGTKWAVEFTGISRPPSRPPRRRNPNQRRVIRIAGIRRAANCRDAYQAHPVKLLSGGNPQIAKANGDAPVQTDIAAMPSWKRDVGRRLDALIKRTVPGVSKAVRWNSPFYGLAGQGWFLGFQTFTNFVKVSFFRGTSLRPAPPGGTGQDARRIDIHEEHRSNVEFPRSWRA